MQVDKSSFLTLIPYLAMTAMMPLVGPVADGMVDRGVPITTVRKLCQVCAWGVGVSIIHLDSIRRGMDPHLRRLFWRRLIIQNISRQPQSSA